MKQQRAQQQVAGSAVASPSAEGPGAGVGNAAVGAEVGGQEAEAGALTAASGGALHAGACGCASCMGGSFAGKHPGFTHIGPDGQVAEEGDGQASFGEEGAAAPDLSGTGEALQAGAVTAGRHPDFPRVYGQTWYAESSLPAAPKVSWTIEENIAPWKEGYTVRVKPTDVGGCTWPVLATPENNDGYKVGVPEPTHPNHDHFVIVSSNAATNILAAEDQHVRDLDHGWYLAAIKLMDGINAVAGGDGVECADPIAGKRELAGQIVGGLGKYGEGIRESVVGGGSMSSPVAGAMNKAFTASQSKRDASGKHSFPLELYAVDDSKNRVASWVKDDVSLDQTSESTVVTFDTIA